MRVRLVEIGVGLFLLAGIGALLLLALNVSGVNLVESKNTYRVYARFEDIGGLTARSKVTMSGVLIGQVTDIRLDPDALQALVEMEIFKDVDYLSADSSASILTAGLLGEKYIGVVVGAEEEFLQEGDFFEDTQSALVLEHLIGKFLFNKVSE
ncbi:MAG: outer membrane lipid asymmetry maintenance protein MlaD [Pontibacterium sp.]